jgi:hypothetical protein
MSDRRNVESVIARDVRALRDTKGMTDPERTVFWMERVARSRFRGRGDTMGAAVQRVADELGAPVSQAKRCWDRWKEMKTVAGSVMIPFMLAYEEMVSANDAAADAYRAERIELKEQRHAADLERAQASVGEGGARLREMAE